MEQAQAPVAAQVGGNIMHLPSTFTPQAFSGTSSENEKAWIRKLEDYFLITNTPDETKPAYLRMLLTGQASTWLAELSEETKADYQLLRTAFLGKFSHQDLKWIRESALMSRKQQNNESVESFLMDIKSKGSQLGKTNDELTTIFVHGLLPDIKSFVMGHNPTSMAEAEQKAILGESISKMQTAQAVETASTNTMQKQIDDLKSMVAAFVTNSAPVNAVQQTQPQRMEYQRDGQYQFQGSYPRRRQNWQQRNQRQGSQCTACGSWNHTVKSQVCSARDKECHNCRGKGHLARMCQSDRSQQNQ